MYDERFQRALKIGGRLFVIVGAAPVMEAWKVTRLGEREWQRESLFETVVDPLSMRHSRPDSSFSFERHQRDLPCVRLGACSIAPSDPSMNIPEITPTEFVARRDRGDALTLLDVREEWELGVASVPGIVHIPMGEVRSASASWIADKEVVVLCRSGRRSLEVARFLQQNGFRAVNLAGGILAWSRDLDATIPTYWCVQEPVMQAVPQGLAGSP